MLKQDRLQRAFVFYRERVSGNGSSPKQFFFILCSGMEGERERRRVNTFESFYSSLLLFPFSFCFIFFLLFFFRFLPFSFFSFSPLAFPSPPFPFLLLPSLHFTSLLVFSSLPHFPSLSSPSSLRSSCFCRRASSRTLLIGGETGPWEVCQGESVSGRRRGLSCQGEQCGVWHLADPFSRGRGHCFFPPLALANPFLLFSFSFDVFFLFHIFFSSVLPLVTADPTPLPHLDHCHFRLIHHIHLHPVLSVLIFLFHSHQCEEENS